MKTPKSPKSKPTARYDLACQRLPYSRRVEIFEMDLPTLRAEFTDVHLKLIELSKLKQQFVENLIVINRQIQQLDPNSLTNRMKRDYDDYVKNRKQID